ncbi:P-type conjugative transfer protein VirB9 [Campylobacter volucris]|uniref:P-type conjugative transfer protein VirB9 n=1 Tax=Campylobacter volucris TaxID=1031542 RepID=UPI00189D3B55|nr:P-type conjugative transfer protein VirB9 [Campylobacter volucris]MBF7060280.1 P-type conjugative transfer protein VirB9 [Campylobacter volucris]
MIKNISLALSFLFLALPVFALNEPQKSEYDQRVAHAEYNSKDVFKMVARNGFVSMIEFSDDEVIINTATGFSEGWDLIEKKNLLFIKPKAYKTRLFVENDPYNQGQQKEMIVDPNPKDWKTNLIVTTNLKTYIFDLLLTNDSKQATYKLSFNYADKILKQENKIKKELENKIVREELDKNIIPRNWDFLMKVNKGSEDIAPNYAYDDGVFTYLGFDNTKTFPSVFSYENGKEMILNTHIKKDGKYDVLVVQKIAKQILLRSGDKVVGIFNNGYGKNPLDKTRETSNENIQRVINDPNKTLFLEQSLLGSDHE